MADLSFPWEMFTQAQGMKNDNSRNMYSDIAGIGAGLGQGIGPIGDLIKQHQLKQIIQKFVQNPQGQGQSQADISSQMPFPQGQPQGQSMIPNPMVGGAGMNANPFGGPLSLGGGQTKNLNGKNYININGQWYDPTV